MGRLDGEGYSEGGRGRDVHRVRDESVGKFGDTGSSVGEGLGGERRDRG